MPLANEKPKPVEWRSAPAIKKAPALREAFLNGVFDRGFEQRLGQFSKIANLKNRRLPDSLKDAVKLETSGVNLSNDALRRVELKHLVGLVENMAERGAFGRLDFRADEDEAKEYCEGLADKVETILIEHRVYGWPDWYEKQCKFARANPATFWGFYNVSECAFKIADIALKHGIGIDPIDMPEMQILPLLLRLTDPNWWLRQQRKKQVRMIEEINRALGRVRKKINPYCCDASVENWKKRRAINNEMMNNTDVENDDGERFTLSEIVKKSNSNPEVRRAELMTRLRGFEILAELLGYKGEFWTITCPSRFHPTVNKKGKNYEYSIENPKWVAAGRPSVRDANRYLSGVWARIRAQFARTGIDWFGFRISEPHADGCPHWHLVLFVGDDHVSKFSGPKVKGKARIIEGSAALLARSKCLADSPTEAGAQKHRFTVEPIKEGFDESGRPYSATAYIAKYISKNIDGEGLGGLDDFDGGGSLADNSRRVVAWASTHGIRQFQQFGGAPVGVWRELRRLYVIQQKEIAAAEKAGREYERDEYLNQLFDQTEQEDAAQAWASFCLIYANNPANFMFQSELKVVQRPVLNYDVDTGLLREFVGPRVVVGRYGEVMQKIEGIKIKSKLYKTRPHVWRLIKGGKAPPDELTAEDEFWRVFSCGLGEAQTHLDLCQ